MVLAQAKLPSCVREPTTKPLWTVALGASFSHLRRTPPRVPLWTPDGHQHQLSGSSFFYFRRFRVFLAGIMCPWSGHYGVPVSGPGYGRKRSVTGSYFKRHGTILYSVPWPSVTADTGTFLPCLWQGGLTATCTHPGESGDVPFVVCDVRPEAHEAHTPARLPLAHKHLWNASPHVLRGDSFHSVVLVLGLDISSSQSMSSYRSIVAESDREFGIVFKAGSYQTT